MKQEVKLLLIVVITMLMTLVVSINVAMPGLLSAGSLIFSVMIALLGIYALKTEKVSTRKGRLTRVSVNKSLWPERDQDPERIMDRLVPVVEDILQRNMATGRVIDGLSLRRELQEGLGKMEAPSRASLLTGQIREVTVLFSDLRGFTSVAEALSAGQVVEMLNRYFTHMCEIIYRHGGIVDKFMGDSIMALFGVPTSRINDVEHAVCCAAKMQIRMDRFNEENHKRGLPELYMGIGLNTGDVIAGKIGSDLHCEYTVIGDEVNLTSRIEAHTLMGQILMSESTYSRVKDLVIVSDPVRVSFKGRKEPVALYELLSIGEPYGLVVPDREARCSRRVEVDLPFQFKTLEGKAACPGNCKGSIINLGMGGMLARTDAEVVPYSNILFRLDIDIFNVRTGEICGKVLEVKDKGEYREIRIGFTSLDPGDREIIQSLLNRLDGSFPR